MATRAQIRTRARVRADQDVGTYPTDSQYNDLIDDSAREVWYDLIVAGWPIDYSTTSFTFATNPRVLGVGNILGIHGVYFSQGSQFYRLRRINEGKRSSLMDPNNGFGQAEFYDVRLNAVNGPVLYLWPPAFGGTYRVDYVPEFAGFSSDSDTWFGPARSDELIALKAASKALHKEGSNEDRAGLDREYAALWEKVTNTASWFDMRNPAMIRDESAYGERFSFDYPVAGPGTWPAF